jgi:hypothetical protein
MDPTNALWAHTSGVSPVKRAKDRQQPYRLVDAHSHILLIAGLVRRSFCIRIAACAPLHRSP